MLRCDSASSNTPVTPAPAPKWWKMGGENGRARRLRRLAQDAFKTFGVAKQGGVAAVAVKQGVAAVAVGVHGAG